MGLFDRKSGEEALKTEIAPVKYNTPRPLTASAAKIDLNNKKEVDAIKKRRQTDKWQEDAWDYFDLIGEIKYSANLVANIMSRVNLYAGFVDDSAAVPADIGTVDGIQDEDFAKAAQDALYLLESGNGGTSGLLRSAALNFFLVGECYLVNEPARFSTNEPSKYQIRSVDEIIAVGGKDAGAFIKPRRDSKPAEYLPLPAGGYMARLWRNHPRYSDEADSSMRGILDICDELLLISRTASATAKSRLNAGLLFVPDGLSNVSQSDGVAEGEEDQAVLADDMSDSFEEELIDAMTTPIGDVGSASAVVPLVLRGPEDLGAKITLLKFERAFDPALAARHDKLIERILAGIDIPKDVAAGMSNVKYANAIVIEEQLYKAHIEPLILLVVDCLTIAFLRPALRAQGFSETLVNRAVVWYDPSAITAKPSKAEAAIALYNIGAVSLATVRRANGFTEAEAPTDLETVQKLAIARGNLSDAMNETILNTLIPLELRESARADALATSDPESAGALTDALGGEVDSTDPSATDTLTTEENTTEVAPPTLMEP